MCSPAGACVRPERRALRSVLLCSIVAHIVMLLCSRAAGPSHPLPAQTHCPCAAAGRCSHHYGSCPSQQPCRSIQKPERHLLASQLCPCAAAGLCSKPC